MSRSTLVHKDWGNWVILLQSRLDGARSMGPLGAWKDAAGKWSISHLNLQVFILIRLLPLDLLDDRYECCGFLLLLTM